MWRIVDFARISNSPHTTDWTCDCLGREAILSFKGIFHIITSDLRSIALLLSRHGNIPSRPYLLGLLRGENAAFEALAKFAQALGTSDDELRASEPLPGCFAYSAFVAWLAVR